MRLSTGFCIAGPLRAGENAPGQRQREQEGEHVADALAQDEPRLPGKARQEEQQGDEHEALAAGRHERGADGQPEGLRQHVEKHDGALREEHDALRPEHTRAEGDGLLRRAKARKQRPGEGEEQRPEQEQRKHHRAQAEGKALADAIHPPGAGADAADGLKALPKADHGGGDERQRAHGQPHAADRSLAMMDYALRRRFAFFGMAPGFAAEGFRSYQESLHSDRFDRLIACVESLNQVISEDESLGDGFRIGHSYFCNLTPETLTGSDLTGIVRFELVPLLREYWFDEPRKVKDWTARLEGAVK